MVRRTPEVGGTLFRLTPSHKGHIFAMAFCTAMCLIDPEKAANMPLLSVLIFIYCELGMRVGRQVSKKTLDNL